VGLTADPQHSGADSRYLNRVGLTADPQHSGADSRYLNRVGLAAGTSTEWGWSEG